jgi:hypothetical protein
MIQTPQLISTQMKNKVINEHTPLYDMASIPYCYKDTALALT